MPRILRTRQSREDYVSIFNYIAQSSPQNAEMIVRLLDERIAFLSRNNLLGRPRPELAPNVRCWNVHRFILYCRPIDDGVILLRVLHSAIDISPKHFQSADESADDASD